MADDDFPVFASDGTMLGNFTSNQGQVPTANNATDWTNFQPLPALPPLSAFAPSQTSQGNVVTSTGAASTGNINVPAPASTYGAPSNAQAGAQPAPSSGVTSGSLADYFFRGVIIILGFIFVAIGLNMFKPGLISNPVKLK